MSIRYLIDAATPWLVGAAGVFFFVALGALFAERRPYREPLAQFRRLGHFWQLLVVLSVCSATRRGGAKPDGGDRGGTQPGFALRVAFDGGGGQLRSGAGITSLSVTDTLSFSNLAFCAIAATSTNVALAATWDSITNREDAIDVYMRTNLVAGAWGHLAEVAIDTASQGVAFDVPAEWLDGAPMAFFRLGSRLDSDGDGLPDDLETLVCGSNPSLADTDGDGLQDGGELAIGTNPSNADTDGDGLDDGAELAIGTNPASGDTDGDGLTDAEELFQFAAATNGPVCWIDISAALDFAILFTNADDEVSHAILPFGFRLSNAVVTNLSVDVNGLVAIGGGNNVLDDSHYQNRHAKRIPIADVTSATIAAFWDDIVVSQEMASSVTFGTVGAAGSRTAVVEFHHVGFHEAQTNDFVSFQVQFPEAEKNVVRVVYSEAAGQGGGGSATLGVRTSCGESIEYSYNEDESVFPGLALTYCLGLGTDPTMADTDGDGLVDGEEVLVWHTDPYLTDTDGDLLPDGFEVLCGFSPTIDNDDDSDLGNEADFDSDGDGLDNFDEYLNGTSPFSADTDGDGVGDAAEARNGSDPLSAADGGQPPPMAEILQIPLHIYGDYAAWEMRLASQGPDDWRTYRISTHRPGDASSVAKALRKGNSYEISMVWNGSGEYANPYWYCWEAQIDDLPSVQTFENYSASRKPNVFNTVVGDGWWAENEDGLLTAHVHTKDGDAGNIAKKRKAYLHVLRPTVEIATNRIDHWEEIAQDKVVMSDEELRIRIKVEPKVPSFNILKQALGDTYTVYTDTAPNGVEVAFASSDEFLQEESWSEVHITKTRQQLRDLGLLPPAEEDEVNEKATLDIGKSNPAESSNLTDSTAFNAITAISRHDATIYGDMDATPPSSEVSKLFFKSAGVEYVRVEYDSVESHSRQIMNQADYFYCSGHGNHRSGTFFYTPIKTVGPSEIGNYWRDDLDCVVFAGCAVLDIEDFVAQRLNPGQRNKWEKAGGACSPGKSWRTLGPTYFLGYGWTAPLDTQGANIIAAAFAAEINAGKTPVEAWCIANDRSAGRNACAIDLSSTPAKYWYWKRNGWGGYFWDCKIEGVDW